ncbi:MAG: hypothetical protein M0036_26640, partial [Desulfobacteraceae bacterium]|nr:hypothetical protein [Desulfobacteraceae bacterium]
GSVPAPPNPTNSKIQNGLTTICWGYPLKSRMRQNYKRAAKTSLSLAVQIRVLRVCCVVSWERKQLEVKRRARGKFPVPSVLLGF